MSNTVGLIRKLKLMGEHKIDYEGLEITISKDVFWSPSSYLLAKNLEIPKESRVLDIGTGSGIQAIVASKNAEKVIATDITDPAIACANLNIRNLGLGDKIEVIRSNLFENVEAKYNRIIFNIPLNPDGEGITPLEIATYDKDAVLLKRFFEEVGDYLDTDGKIIFLYASFGRLNTFNQSLKENGFKSKVKDISKNGDSFKVYEIFH